MLTAFYQDQRIVAPEAERDVVKRFSRAGNLGCPGCSLPVVFHAGPQKAWHFKHKSGASDCPFDADPDYRPESELHVRMKLALRDWVREQFPPQRFPGASVDVEVHVPETGQFADVMLTLPVERERTVRIALEVQCSPLSGAHWRERAARYAEAGVVDVWLLTEEAHAPKRKHVEVSGRGLRKLKDLPSTVLFDRAQVFVLTADADALKAEGVRSVLVEVLHGLAGKYGGLDDPAAMVQGVRERPVACQPEWLADKKPWRCLDNPPPSFTPQPESFFEGFLSDCWIEAGAVPMGGELWVSAAHRAAHIHSFAWEEANRKWHAEWLPRRAVHDRTVRVQQMHRLIGEAVRNALPKLLSVIGALAHAGQRSQNEDALLQHTALPEGVRKWRLAFWTPLADVAVPLDWVFGVDPRLWQMTTYAYGLSAMYAKDFRAEHGIKTVGFNRLATGYALKVLALKKLHRTAHTERLETLLSALNKRLRSIAIPYADLITCDEENVPIVALGPHRLRHLVVGAYLGKLASYTFLTGPVEASWEPQLRTRKGWGGIREVPEKRGDPASVLERIDKCLYMLAHPKRTLTAEELGASWLRLAETAMCTPTGEFEFATPRLPPCYKRDVASRIRRAMQAGTITVTPQGVLDGSNLLYEIPGRIQKGRR